MLPIFRKHIKNLELYDVKAKTFALYVATANLVFIAILVMLFKYIKNEDIHVMLICSIIESAFQFFFACTFHIGMRKKNLKLMGLYVYLLFPQFVVLLVAAVKAIIELICMLAVDHDFNRLFWVPVLVLIVFFLYTTLIKLLLVKKWCYDLKLKLQLAADEALKERIEKTKKLPNTSENKRLLQAQEQLLANKTSKNLKDKLDCKRIGNKNASKDLKKHLAQIEKDEEKQKEKERREKLEKEEEKRQAELEKGDTNFVEDLLDLGTNEEQIETIDETVQSSTTESAGQSSTTENSGQSSTTVNGRRTSRPKKSSYQSNANASI